jgi:hypothetical protein
MISASDGDDPISAMFSSGAKLTALAAFASSWATTMCGDWVTECGVKPWLDVHNALYAEL